MAIKKINWSQIGNIIAVGTTAGFMSLSIFLYYQLTALQELQRITNLTNQRIISQVKIISEMQRLTAGEKAQAAAIPK